MSDDPRVAALFATLDDVVYVCDACGMREAGHRHETGERAAAHPLDGPCWMCGGETWSTEPWDATSASHASIRDHLVMVATLPRDEVVAAAERGATSEKRARAMADMRRSLET